MLTTGILVLTQERLRSIGVTRCPSQIRHFHSACGLSAERSGLVTPTRPRIRSTTALQTGPHGDWWKKANIQIYGWVDIGMNLSTSSARPYGNLPAAYAEIPNTFQLDQATLYIERTPDTVQTDHFDWGFRLTNLYGLDYRFTTAEGYFSQQLLNNPQKNGSLGEKLGYDPVMAYVDLYFPKLGQGTDVRIGRYISLPDIEAQLAPNNYTYTHSLTYTYDCYTQTGINMTTKWSDHWTTQVGVSGGCEAAPWAPDAKLTGNACVGYTWAQGGDNIYICANSDQRQQIQLQQSGSVLRDLVSQVRPVQSGTWLGRHGIST